MEEFYKRVNVFTIALCVCIFERCVSTDHDDDDDDDNDKDVGITMGQIAAIAIGGVVVLALITIAIVALILKCNKKAKPAISPTNVTEVHRSPEKDPSEMYGEPPPTYSLRDVGHAHQVSLPPYEETYPTKHAL